jgi:NDP-sugar pyrophosphorylase family protein
MSDPPPHSLFGAGNVAGVTATVLAGGLGTRLRPAIGDLPKALAPVHGRPFLTYLLDGLVNAGFSELVLLAGYRADHVCAAFGDTYRGRRLTYSVEPSPLGTGGAVRFALPKLASATILLMNGDSCCEADLAAFRHFHEEKAADMSMVLVGTGEASRYGSVELAVDARVVRFGEKEHEGAGGWINAGIYLLKRALIEEIPEGSPASLERDLFPAWIARGARIYGFRSTGRFIDIGTPASLAEAEEFFAANAQ